MRAGCTSTCARPTVRSPGSCTAGCTSSSFAAGAGAIALVFAEYLGRLVPFAPGQIRLVAIPLIILLAAAQYRSVRFGAAIQNVSTAAKVLAILA